MYYHGISKGKGVDNMEKEVLSKDEFIKLYITLNEEDRKKVADLLKGCSQLP
jgi:hypothetical protein